MAIGTGGGGQISGRRPSGTKKAMGGGFGAPAGPGQMYAEGGKAKKGKKDAFPKGAFGKQRKATKDGKKC